MTVTASWWERLRQRKLVQWGAAYLAGAWLLLQVLGLLAQPFAWPDLVLRAAAILLGIGFFAALVIAWYHGERGAQRVSGIELLMLAGILVVAAAAVAFVGGGLRKGKGAAPGADGPVVADAARAGRPGTASVPLSVAVLPFTNVGRDSAQDYLSDGLSEELIAALAEVPGLRVAARSSSFYFKGKELPPDEIGRRLRVASVLEGSVRRSANRLRVTAALVDVASGASVWSRTYDGQLTEVLDVQETLAREIVRALSPRLGTPARPRTRSVVAFDHYMRGTHLLRTPGPATLRQAVIELKAATAADPAYAAAYAALSQAYQMLAFWHVEPASAVVPLSETAVRRALALDSASADAWAALAQIERWWHHDRTAAAQAIERALRLDPESSNAHGIDAWFLIDTRQTELAVREGRRAWELDSFSVTQSSLLSELLYNAGDAEGALRQARLTLALDSSYLAGWADLAAALILGGRAAEAVAVLERRRQDLDAFGLAALGQAYAAAGRRADARAVTRALEARAQSSWVNPALIAVVYVALGERDRALDLLEAAEARGSLWPELDATPDFNALHGDPRYERLLRKLGVRS